MERIILDTVNFVGVEYEVVLSPAVPQTVHIALMRSEDAMHLVCWNLSASHWFFHL
jgi:hypothetical protein